MTGPNYLKLQCLASVSKLTMPIPDIRVMNTFHFILSLVTSPFFFNENKCFLNSAKHGLVATDQVNVQSVLIDLFST